MAGCNQCIITRFLLACPLAGRETGRHAERTFLLKILACRDFAIGLVEAIQPVKVHLRWRHELIGRCLNRDGP